MQHAAARMLHGVILAKPTAVLVDGAQLIRIAFPSLMRRLDVRGTFETADALIEAQQRADVTVLELHGPMELRAGVTALRSLVAARYTVCVYTSESSPFVHAACLASGAAGVVSKTATIDLAQSAFLEVAGGAIEFPPGLLMRLQLLGERDGLRVLSPREREILAMRATGLTISEIAAVLEEPEATATREWRAITLVLRDFLACASLDMAARLLDLDCADPPDLWPSR